MILTGDKREDGEPVFVPWKHGEKKETTLLAQDVNALQRGCAADCCFAHARLSKAQIVSLYGASQEHGLELRRMGLRLAEMVAVNATPARQLTCDEASLLFAIEPLSQKELRDLLATKRKDGSLETDIATLTQLAREKHGDPHAIVLDGIAEAQDDRRAAFEEAEECLGAARRMAGRAHQANEDEKGPRLRRVETMLDEVDDMVEKESPPPEDDAKAKRLAEIVKLVSKEEIDDA